MTDYTDLEKYYRESYDMLVKTYSKSAGAPENAEDVVQEAFARACQYWASYNPERGMISTWFRTILLNALRDYKRDERNRGMFVELEHADEVLYEDEHLDQHLLRAVVKEMDTFSPAQSRILQLAYLHNYTARDITKVEDTTVGNVWWTVSAFRKHIKEKFGEAFPA